MNAFACLITASNIDAFCLIIMLFLYAYLVSHFSVRQTELRLAIRLSHSVLFYYNKKANIICDV